MLRDPCETAICATSTPAGCSNAAALVATFIGKRSPGTERGGGTLNSIKTAPSRLREILTLQEWRMRLQCVDPAAVKLPPEVATLG